MASKLVVTGAISVALLMALSAGQAPAIAQDQPQAMELEAITVMAPRITRSPRESGKRVELTTVQKSAYVNFGDLDLTRTADLYTLEDRVREAAAKVCKDLADQYPEGEPSTEVCTRRATDDTMVLVRQAARDAARKGAGA